MGEGRASGGYRFEGLTAAGFGTLRGFDFPPHQLPEHHHYIGPLWWEPPAQAPAYLETSGDPWVLATLSSKAQPGEQDLVESVARVLGRQPVRAVMTVRTPHTFAGGEPLPSNIYVEAYVAHAAVLQQSRLFLSPAGHGAVMKALYYGVPMVLIPLGSDQPGVAARAEHLGVAQVISRAECTDERLKLAIHEVLNRPKYRQQAQVVSRRLQSSDPVSIACDLIARL
jgi:UDP:flavonoid glycosyltransferase YjiC (YdhE family)